MFLKLTSWNPYVLGQSKMTIRPGHPERSVLGTRQHIRCGRIEDHLALPVQLSHGVVVSTNPEQIFCPALRRLAQIDMSLCASLDADSYERLLG